MERKELLKPPIKEAILEVLLPQGEECQLIYLEEFFNIVNEQFPTKTDVFKFEGQISNNSEQESRLQQTRIGFNYMSEDKNKSIQVRKNGFTFLQLNKTYIRWEDFKPLAFEWLLKFVDYAGITKAGRISLRFVNEIKVPQPVDDLGEYFLTLPVISEKLNVGLKDFFLRMECLSDKFPNIVGVITELLQPSTAENIALFLDIDVIKVMPEGQEIQLTDEKLSTEFDVLREFKNTLFFESLTDKAELLFS